jgi:hypothetical protein
LGKNTRPHQKIAIAKASEGVVQVECLSSKCKALSSNFNKKKKKKEKLNQSGHKKSLRYRGERIIQFTQKTEHYSNFYLNAFILQEYNTESAACYQENFIV